MLSVRLSSYASSLLNSNSDGKIDPASGKGKEGISCQAARLNARSKQHALK